MVDRQVAHGRLAERPGGIEAEEARSPAGQWAGVRAEYADALLSVAGPEFESGRAEGRRVTLVEAIEYALAEA